jgi:hypothetical protein
LLLAVAVASFLALGLAAFVGVGAYYRMKDQQPIAAGPAPAAEEDQGEAPPRAKGQREGELGLKQRKQAAENAITAMEQEIARLKMELVELAREDGRRFDRVAKQTVEVQKLEKQVDGMRAALDKEERRIVAMKASYDAAVKAEQKQVRHGDRSYDLKVFRSDLLAAAARFEIEEELLRTRVEQLAVRKKTLERNRRLLAEMKLVREQIGAELERLEAALHGAAPGDADEAKLRTGIAGMRDKLKILKQKQILEGEIDGPVQAEKRKEQEAADERFLKERFGEKR